MRSSKILVASLMVCISSLVVAQAPSAAAAGPFTLIVPYPAGGASDITARIVSEPVGRELDAPVIVENIGGATGGIAAQKMLNAPADGRIFYQGSQNELILPPLTIKGTRYQSSEFEIVHPVTTTRLVLVVRAGLPVKTLQEFIELGRTRSGTEPLSYGSPGVGSLYHLVSDSMGKLAAVRYTHIPYRGSAPLMQDLIGERIDFTVMAFSTTMLPFAEAGRYRIIANLSRDKPRELVRLPSVSDAAAFKDMDYASNSAYYVKKGTPQAVRQRLNTAIGNAVASPSVIKALEDDGRRVPARMSVAEAEDFYRAELAKYQRMVKLTGFVAQEP
jgi:tripartite-type tricarboxylate transporter receptor subunit TctC